ncbi:hypothetical protein GGS21DRAFT_488654 [Xylaria nigripes]|nr:hypothetical protein GGS21DRAFT_488654 [Xylaria nigripes]
MGVRVGSLLPVAFLRNFNGHNSAANMSISRTWQGEYMYCLISVTAAVVLIILLYIYNGKSEPSWSGDLRLSTALIAIMSIYRLGLKAIVETCISQGAWIWVSGFRKGKTEAKLEDFKLFDEASRGLYGALALLWRMKASHFACIGSVITILIQGFETFSSQMVEFTDIPTVLTDETSLIARLIEAPPRSETWHNLVSGSFSETFLELSAKAAVYEGIMGTTVSDVPVFCEEANCTWPIFPSLAVCGACSESLFSTSCRRQTGCTYSMSSGTSISSPPISPFQYRFMVTPSNRSLVVYNVSSKAIISTFDIMSAAKTTLGTDVQAHQCGLWFCLRSYNVTVMNGIANRSVTAEWSKSEATSGADEYVFQDIPAEMNVLNRTRYSVPLESIHTLKTFINKLTIGNASQLAGIVSYDTDWIQAIEAASKDLNGWISRFALSLTNHIQLTGTVRPDGNVGYGGTAYIMTSHVKVNWYWVAYPVSLMFFAFMYLLQTV